MALTILAIACTVLGFIGTSVFRVAERLLARSLGREMEAELSTLKGLLEARIATGLR